MIEVDGKGTKFDFNKPRWELVPPEITALVDLFTQGAKKYGDRNWEKGMSWGRIFGALMRHAWLWMAGEEYDQETGAHHMIAVAWNAIVLYVYHKRKVGTDDRNIQRPAEVQTEEAATGFSVGNDGRAVWKASEQR